jgi:hypothetical protein
MADSRRKMERISEILERFSNKKLQAKSLLNLSQSGLLLVGSFFSGYKNDRIHFMVKI